jgi:acetyl-CoA synthetase
MQKLRRPATYVLSRLYSTSHALYNTRKDPVQLGKILCDNHDPNKTALKYISSATKTLGIYEEVSFAQLRSLSSSIAQFLLENNLQPNGRVAVLLPKTIELFASSVGIWRAGGCYVPLFTAFAYEAIKHRVLDSGAKFIITDKENRHKLDQIPEIVNDPTMTIITVTSDSIIHNKKAKEFNFNEMYTTTSKTIINKSVLPQDNMILLYTSGTTGKPKAVQVPVHALNAFETYMNYSLYVEPNDIFWNVAGSYKYITLIF